MSLSYPLYQKVSYCNKDKSEISRINSAIAKRFPNITKKSSSFFVGVVDEVDINKAMGGGAPDLSTLSNTEISMLNSLCRLFWHLRRFQTAMTKFSNVKYKDLVLGVEAFGYLPEGMIFGLESLEREVLHLILKYKMFDGAIVLVAGLTAYFCDYHKALIEKYGDEDVCSDLNACIDELSDVGILDDEADDFSSEIKFWAENFISYAKMSELLIFAGAQDHLLNPSLFSKNNFDKQVDVMRAEFYALHGFDVKMGKSKDVLAEIKGFDSGYQQLKGSLIDEVYTRKYPEFIKRKIDGLNFRLLNRGAGYFKDLNSTYSEISKIIAGDGELSIDEITDLSASLGSAYYQSYEESIKTGKPILSDKIEVLHELSDLVINLIALFQKKTNTKPVKRPETLKESVIRYVVKNSDTGEMDKDTLVQAITESSDDGFELAMHLKDEYSWDIKRDDPDDLDELLFKIEKLDRNLETIWFNVCKIKKPLKIGDFIEQGEITGVSDHQLGYYLVKVPMHDDNSRLLVKFENAIKN